MALQRFSQPGLRTQADTATDDPPLYTLRYNAATASIDYWAGHGWEPNKTPKTLVEETKELIALRDIATQLIAAQRDGEPEHDREQLRAHLNTLYDNYVGKRGPLNRFEWVQRNATQTRHDKRIAKLEQDMARAGGRPPDGPTTGPFPTNCAEQWDNRGLASRPSRSRSSATSKAACAMTPAGRSCRRWKTSTSDTGTATQSADLHPRRAHRRHRARHRRHPRRSPGDEPGPHPRRRRRPHLRAARRRRRGHPRPARRPGLPQPRRPRRARSRPPPRCRATCAPSSPPRSRPPTPTRSTSPTSRALREVQPEQREAEDIKVRPGAPWIPAAVIAAFAEKTFGVTGVTGRTHRRPLDGRRRQLQAPRPPHDRRMGPADNATSTR